ncbi:hypothetical protein R1sor_025233 [Riccia sorocarpa]|uniref:Uncharacterized protein n=1 Tax=Riccia sorocarpa TaxID=122646 RepID=A0ABD3G811_9MARC
MTVESTEDYKDLMGRERPGLEDWEKATKTPKVEQERLLEHILKKNGSSLYLQQFGLNGATDVHTFRELVPVCNHEDILPYIERIVQGDKAPLLTGDPVIELCQSSGTTGGQPKVYPITEEDITLRVRFQEITRSIFNGALPKQERGKTLFFMNLLPAQKTPGGLLQLPASTSVFQREVSKAVLQFTSPKEVILASNFKEATYCHLLCGLLQRDQVIKIRTTFASFFVMCVRYLEECWPEICDDIVSGTLNQTRVQNYSVRAAVLPYLRPDPELADTIRQKCLGKGWKGIVKSLWPKCKVVQAICTGSMAAYMPILNYYTDNLPVLSGIYACSEGFFGVNMDPTCLPEATSYTLIPTVAYFEFVPLADDQQKNNHKDQIVDLTSVKEGHEYEILVTTISGLSRYRIGDVLKVVGFHNATPKFEFVRREGTVLSVDVEKTTERELLLGMTSAAKLLEDHLGLRLEDFTSTGDLSTSPPHYIIYLELKNDESAIQDVPTDILEKCCSTVESSLGDMYRSWRFRNFIGPLEFRIVQEKTFEKMMAVALLRGATAAQFKTPRGLGPQHSHYLEVLTNGLSQCYVSQSRPQSPGF